MGFWSVFDVNILQYAGISDVVSTALFPVVIGVVAVMFSIWVGQLSRSSVSTPNSAQPPQVPWLICYLLRKGRVVAVFYLTFLIVLMYSDAPGKWTALPIIVGLGLAIYLGIKKISFTSHLSLQVQSWIVLIIVTLPLFAIDRGNFNAGLIRDGVAFLYVVAPDSAVVPNTPPEKKSRLLGHIGDYDFFYDPELKSVRIAKVKDDSVLELKKYKREQKSADKIISDFCDSVAREVKKTWSKAFD